MVRGKYFMVVNADDPLLPGCISRLVDFLEARPDVLCAYPHVQVINEDGSRRTILKRPPYDFTYMVRHHTSLPSAGAMFRTSVIQEVGYRDISFRWLGDFDYWLRVGLQGPMALCPSVLATWRHRTGQASRDKSDERAAEHVRVIDKLYKTVGPGDMLWEVHDEALCWANLVAAGLSKSRFRGIRYIGAAIEVYPNLFTSLEFWDIMRHRLTDMARR
jgi:GT2 family glycosyltransferase